MPRVSYDENGMVVGFNYHDGRLHGVIADSARAEVHLALCSVSGEQRVVSLRGVLALDVRDFWQGNIIGYMWVMPASSIASNSDVLRELAERLRLEPSKLSPQATIFRLDSSYGADVIAVCDAVDVSEGEMRLSLLPAAT